MTIQKKKKNNQASVCVVFCKLSNLRQSGLTLKLGSKLDQLSTGLSCSSHPFLQYSPVRRCDRDANPDAGPSQLASEKAPHACLTPAVPWDSPPRAPQRPSLCRPARHQLCGAV